MKNLRMPKAFLLAFILCLAFSCKPKKEVITTDPIIITVEKPAPTVPAFRSSFDYNRLTAKTAYDSLFVDAGGNKTVDLYSGNTRLDMFSAINTELGKVNGANNQNLDSLVFKNMFEGNSFSSSNLNSTGLSIKNVVSGASNPSKVYTQFFKWFAEIDKASDSVNTVAKEGKAGKLTAANGTSKYLLDKNGLEIGQLIQKGLIGAYQYDYIANVLFSDSKLSADNHYLVPGKNYTELEHNWDEAYATLTNRKVFTGAATPMGVTPASSGERFLGSYVWEYGRTTTSNPEYLQIHAAFLKGRAAIINNDITEAKLQSNIIKSNFEKAIASAAVSYLEKGPVNTDIASGKHQLAEGLGFVYSLRFCKFNGGDDAFSDELLNDLVYTNVNGVWTLTSAKAKVSIDKIKSKFKL